MMIATLIRTQKICVRNKSNYDDCYFYFARKFFECFAEG